MKKCLKFLEMLKISNNLDFRLFSRLLLFFFPLFSAFQTSSGGNPGRDIDFGQSLTKGFQGRGIRIRCHMIEIVHSFFSLRKQF